MFEIALLRQAQHRLAITSRNDKKKETIDRQSLFYLFENIP